MKMRRRILFKTHAGFVFFIALCLGSQIGNLPFVSAQESTSDELVQIDDLGDANYTHSMYQLLERIVPHDPEYAREWSLISFVIERDGKLNQIKLNNSTGNAKFDTTILKALRSVSSLARPAGSNDRIKVTHPFNYVRATRNIASSRLREVGSRSNTGGASHANNSLQTSGISDKLASLFGIQDRNANSNAAAMFNILFNLAEIFLIGLVLGAWLGGGFSFFLIVFLAVPVWWLHRLLLGRFPD
jgi:TonB family protein